MSEELKTPRGRVLHPVKRRDKPDVTEWRGDPLQVWITASRRFTACFDESSSADFDTMAEALDWLDARADETVAALLPKGSIVTSKDAVSGACEDAIKQLIGGKDDDEVAAFVAHVLSALRAGAKS